MKRKRPNDSDANKGLPDPMLGGWTARCPDVDRILALAERRPESTSDRALVAHVRSCSFCKRLYAQTCETLEASGVRQPYLQRTEQKPKGFRLGFAAGLAVASVVWLLLFTSPWGRPARGGLPRVSSGPASPAVDARVIPSADLASFEAAVFGGRLQLPAEVLQQGGVLRGSPGAVAANLALIRPNRTYVLDDRPQLVVAAGQGVRGVQAVLTDVGGEEVALERVSPSVWRPKSALRRGESYQWSANGTLRGGRVWAAVAFFEVLDARRAEEAASWNVRYRDFPLMQAVLFAKTGLLDDAESALRRAVAERPGRSVAPALLRDLRQRRARAN